MKPAATKVGGNLRFHCLFGPSQLRRLGPKGPRNTSVEGALPRAARAFGAACPGLVCFALSALLPLRGNKMQIGQVRPGGPYHAYPRVAAPGGRRNPGCDSNLELRPEGATLARHVQTHRTGERHIVHPTSIIPMKHAAAKVGGNQGRMVGRRRAVGFLQIVPAKRRGGY